MKKINSIDEAKLGITIVQEVLASFTIPELKAMTKDQFLDAIDTQNAYEEDWQEWKDSGIYYLYLYAYEVLTEQL